MDNLSKNQRSYCMSRIKSVDTKPELSFRRYIWEKGLRGYRLHKNIIGKPDISFSKKNIAVFIDGCFWHKCPICFREPKSDNGYWKNKLHNNQMRDQQINKTLKSQNIRVVRFWAHEIKNNMEGCYKQLNNLYEKN